MTTIVTDNTAKTILSGAEKLYKPVSSTMGPRGSNVIFRKLGKKVAVTHDGVTVAKAVSLGEGIEDVGADLLREAAMKLDVMTGDGTTTVTVLAYEMLKEAVNQIEKGENPMRLKLQLDKDQIEVLDAIKKATKKATDKDIVSVAKVASGDEFIGTQVGELVASVGEETPVFLDVNESTETTTEVINGFKLYSGSASPYFLDEAGVRHEARDVRIVVCDAKLRDKEDILPILRVVSTLAPEDRKVLIVANSIAADALSLCLANKLKGFADISVVCTPETIVNKTDYLNDLAIATGSVLLSKNGAFTYFDPKEEDFGSAKRIVVELGQTVIVEGDADPEQLERHTATIQKLSKETANKAIKKFAEDRLKTLGQKIAIIRVGGQSETEVEEKIFRYEDAIGASQAAQRKGVVPGGGTLLYDVANQIKNLILKAALKAPIKKIYQNAGIEFNDHMNDIRAGYGVDVMSPDRGVVDLVKEGIIDPAESEEQCVRTAVAISGLLMTSGAIIVDERENKNETSIETSLNQA